MMRVKWLTLMVLSVFLMIGVTGCMNESKMISRKDWPETAEKLLQEKYGESFKVVSIGNSYGTGTDLTFTVYCHPVKDETVLFEAEIYKSGQGIEDDYLTSLMSVMIEKELMTILKAYSLDVMAIVNIKDELSSESQLPTTFKEYVDYFKGNTLSISIVVDRDTIFLEHDDWISLLENLSGFIGGKDTTEVIIKWFFEDTDAFKAIRDLKISSIVNSPGVYSRLTHKFVGSVWPKEKTSDILDEILVFLEDQK